MNILTFLITMLSLAGIYITREIKRNKLLKEKGEDMVCLVGHKCDEVVFSDYSKFFGIPLEFLGLIYYTYTALFYLTYILNSSLISESVFFISLGLTFGGFLFSIYLTYIQIFKLKSLCTWCISSAVTSTLIFLLSYSLTLISKPEIFEYIQHVQPFIKGLEFVSLILGVSIFVILEILSFKFLRDLVLTNEEDRALMITAQIGWFILFIFILSNIGIYLPAYMLSGVILKTFTTELIVISVIILNTITYNLQVLPEIKESFARDNNIWKVGRIYRLRNVAFIQGLVSIITWTILLFINLG